MTHHDRRGTPLATSSGLAASALVEGTDRFLTAQPGAVEALARAVGEDPSFIEARTALSLALLFDAQPGPGLAQLDEAERLAAAVGAGDGARLRSQAALVRALTELDAGTAGPAGRRHLREHPLDDLAREAAGITLFGCGRSEELMALMEQLAPSQGSDWAFASSHSFASHEVGELTGARRLAEVSLAARPDNAFAVHSLAHVFYETGDHPGGAAVLAEFTARYDPSALEYRHLHWHRALHALATGDEEEVVALWRRAIAPGAVPTEFSVMEDGAGLLWRWHLAGGEGWELPWDSLAARAAEVATQPAGPLVAASAVVVLAAVGDRAATATLLDRSADRAAEGYPLPVGVLAAVAEAAVASFDSDWDAVADALGPVQGDLWRLGGSRAQRQLFEDAYLVGLVLAERGDEALPLLAGRLARRPSDLDSALALVARTPAPGTP